MFAELSSTKVLERLGYTLAEACQVIPISRSKLYREIKAGNIRATRHGTRVLISRAAIEEYLGDRPSAAESPGFER